MVFKKIYETAKLPEETRRNSLIEFSVDFYELPMRKQLLFKSQKPLKKKFDIFDLIKTKHL